MTDHYATLGVAKNATPEDIKKAYRRLAAIHHPDKGGDTAEFQKVQAAYETLSDPQKRQQHDNPNPFGGQGGPGFHGGFPGGFEFHMNGFDMHDIFGQMFGGGRPGGFKPQQPSYRTTIWITLEQAYSGGEQLLQMQGSPNPVKIQIPKGVENGQALRFDNLIPNSILIAEFRIHPHSKFEREGPNLYSVAEINVLDLIVGSTLKFTTISGKELDVTIPKASQPGSKLRISGEGMPVKNDFGDQYILLKPFTPDRIDERIVEAIKQYR